MTMTKTIALIGGTGNEGPGLAALWAVSGQYQVIIGSRQAEKAERVASEINTKLGQELVKGLANEAAVAAGIRVAWDAGKWKEAGSGVEEVFEPLSVRLSNAEKSKIYRRADEDGLTATAWLREVALWASE